MPSVQQREQQSSAPPSAGGNQGVTAVITNYNGMGCLPATLSSLDRCGFAFAEIIVVDDGSTDGSCEWLREKYPKVKLLGFPTNTRCVNRVRNLGLSQTTTRYAFLMDNDICVLPGALEALLAVALAHPQLAAATPRLLHTDQPHLIYSDGAGFHFLGVSTAQPREQPVDTRPVGQPFQSFGCGIMLIDVDNCQRIGMFDELCPFGWGEDGEYHLRARLLGYDALHVQNSVCLHTKKDHELRRGYAQLYNRYRIIFKIYSTRSIILLAPSLLGFEAGTFATAAMKGFLRDYFRAIADTWANRKELGRTRRDLQARRRRRDHEVLEGGGFETPATLQGKGPAALAMRLFASFSQWNWRVVRGAI
jgi:GT2 family glycosyltransferase